MKSLRRHEGYLMIDHRATCENVPGTNTGFVEVATYTCSHCQTVVVINPLRNRARAYCPKCDHMICDLCGAKRAANGGECKTFQQVVDEVQESAAKDAQRGSIILTT